jgi:hypothetical protein
MNPGRFAPASMRFRISPSVQPTLVSFRHTYGSPPSVKKNVKRPKLFRQDEEAVENGVERHRNNVAIAGARART